MDFSLTSEQKEYKKEIVKFARNKLNNPEYADVFSTAMWREIADFGLLGLTVGEEYGGMGESYTTAAVAFEALGYGCKNNGLTFVVNNHIWVSQNLIYLYGSDRLKDKYIPAMVTGRKIGAMAITEAEYGSDAMGMSSYALEREDGFLLNGSKMFISNGPIADVFVVFAVTKNDAAKKITAFVVEKEFVGVSVSPDIEKMGLNACPTSELILSNVFVPKENVLGKIDNGGNILTQAIEWERCFEFVPHIGAMQRVMEECLAYVNARKQFGKKIGEYQAVSHKIADMQVGIELSRQLMYKITYLKDKKRCAYMETSIFKLFVSERYIKTCTDAMQIFGAYGYTKEYGLEREVRDALACSIYSGTNEIQKNTIFNILNTRYS